MLQEVIKSVSDSVQPLVFETGHIEYPYSARGTVFIVGYMGHAFVLTSRHGLHPDDCHPLCVFPNDTSNRIIPLKDVFWISDKIIPDDFVDLAVIEIDMEKITDSEIGNARLIDLNLASGDWLSKSDAAEMFILGYPDDYTFVDYDNESIGNHRFTLYGRYAGKSEIDYLHKFEVTGEYTLSTFSGLSGGPVFALVKRSESHGDVVICGMALRGTTSSGLIHFLDRSVLIDALKIKIKKSKDY